MSVLYLHSCAVNLCESVYVEHCLLHTNCTNYSCSSHCKLAMSELYAVYSLLVMSYVWHRFWKRIRPTGYYTPCNCTYRSHAIVRTKPAPFVLIQVPWNPLYSVSWKCTVSGTHFADRQGLWVLLLLLLCSLSSIISPEELIYFNETSRESDLSLLIKSKLSKLPRIQSSKARSLAFSRFVSKSQLTSLRELESNPSPVILTPKK